MLASTEQPGLALVDSTTVREADEEVSAPPGGSDRAARRGSNGGPEDLLGPRDTSAVAREKKLQLDTRELLASHCWPKANLGQPQPKKLDAIVSLHRGLSQKADHPSFS